MIEVKNKLCGNISTKEKINSKLNIGIEKQYPELEDLTVIPSIEEQHFIEETHSDIDHNEINHDEETFDADSTNGADYDEYNDL